MRAARALRCARHRQRADCADPVRAGARAAFKTIKTVKITNARGYFDTTVKFSASGTARLAWTYPAHDPFLSLTMLGASIASRSVTITVH